MNHKLKRKWVASLRGGTYDQCHGALIDGDKRCALGVLFEIEPAIHDDWEPAEQFCYANQVIKLNDWEMKTFPEIADWIEENVPETPL